MSRCLHCDKEEANYCETCYQDLISKNAKLQKEIDMESKKENVDNEYEKMIIDIYRIVDLRKEIFESEENL